MRGRFKPLFLHILRFISAQASRQRRDFTATIEEASPIEANMTLDCSRQRLLIASNANPMKTHIIFPLMCLVLVSGIVPLHSADVEVLDNASVIALQKLNLGDPVVVDKIKTSKCNFDTSIKGLTELKQANVSPAVIQAMLATKSAASPATAPSVVNGDLNNPLAPHPGGVWVCRN
jgi:hypothetical protein